MPVSELYTAAQTGLVEGTVTLPLSVASRKLEEIFRFSVLKPVFTYNYLGMPVSKPVLDGMPSDIRKIVLESSNEAVDYGTSQTMTVCENYIKELKGKGVTFVTITPAEWAQFHKRFREVHESFIEDNPKAFKELFKVVEQTR